VSSGALLLVLTLGCAGRQTATSTGQPPPAAAGPEAALPPLPGPGSPESAFRRVSASQVQVNADATANSGGTGNQNHVDSGTHTLSLVPGGEDDLAYAVYTVPNLSVNRPVQLNITASLLHPGGEDPLEYWVMVSDYSTGRWKLKAGPNADKSFSAASLVLNSATDRERLVSAPQGPGGPAFSYAVLTAGNASNSSGLPYDQQPRVELSVSTTNLLPETDPGYFKTAPLPAQLSGAEANPQAGSIALDLFTDPAGGAERVYIQRSVAGSGQWQELGFVGGTAMAYVDPDDNSLPGATAPQQGPNYLYRAIAAAEDGATELRAGYSNEQAATLSGNLPPAAELTALPSQVNAGESVSFDASASTDPDGTVADYAWDFNGNGVFDEPGPELAAHGAATPAPYVYANPGVYLAAVRVTDNGGLSADAIKQIDVNAPPTAAILPDSTDGPVPLLVNFDATGSTDSDGTLANYEWDLDGNGVYNEDNGESAAQGNPHAQFLYNAAGAYQPAVRVTDDDGATSTASVTVTVRGWTTLTVDSAASVGNSPSLAVVNGVPAISYTDATNGDLKYALSSTADGKQAADWACITVASTNDTGLYSSLAVINGAPAIAYYDLDSDALMYAFSSTVDGASPGDWGTTQVAGPAGLSTRASLAEVNGFPAIGYYDSSNTNLDYAYSTTADGSDNWSTVVVDGFGSDVGNFPSLAVVNAKPALSYYDETNGHLKYAYSSTANGSSGWSSVTVDSGLDVGYDTSLAVVDGFPAISYGDGGVGALKYAWSSAVDGSSGWNTLQVDGAPNVGSYTSLAVINGVPAIGYRDNPGGALKYAWSAAPDGSLGWSNFTVDGTGDAGVTLTLAAVDGKPALAYYAATPAVLRYAFGP
jgi:hypothetical protein